MPHSCFNSSAYQNSVLTDRPTERTRTVSAVSSPPAGILQGSQGPAHITPPWQAFPTPQPAFTCPVHCGAASHESLTLHASHESTVSPALKSACTVRPAQGPSLNIPFPPAWSTNPRALCPNHRLHLILLYQCQQKATGSNNPVFQKVLKLSICKYTRKVHLCAVK